jgi:hypothetical protein
VIGRGSEFCSAPDAYGRAWMLIGNDRTLALWRPIRRAGMSVLNAWCMTRFDQRVRSVTEPARPVDHGAWLCA